MLLLNEFLQLVDILRFLASVAPVIASVIALVIASLVKSPLKMSSLVGIGLILVAIWDPGCIWAFSIALFGVVCESSSPSSRESCKGGQICGLGRL